jgi:23S rRNA-/tRNA-specific pseudouridylate synthase
MFKPRGLVVQSAFAETVSVESILHECGLRNVYFPHRLDKYTAGLLCVALNKSTCSALATSLIRKQWTKQYTVTCDLPNPSQCLRNGNSVDRAPKCHEYLKSPHLSGHLLVTAERKSDPSAPAADASEYMYVDGFGLAKHALLRSFLARRSLRETKLASMRYARELSGACACKLVRDFRNVHPFIPDTMLYESVQVGESGSDAEKAKEAVSEFSLLNVDASSRKAYFRVKLHTGRSHQIRIHAADAGLPISNDPYYNFRYYNSLVQEGKSSSSYESHDMGLLASLLSFPNPLAKETINVAITPQQDEILSYSCMSSMLPS